MSELDVFTVEQSLPGQRLDRFLHSRYETSSRAEIQRLLSQGCVRVNGRPPKPAQAPRAGDLVEIRWPDVTAAEVAPQEIPLDVLFEDSDLLVLNKQPDLVVHPAAGHEDGTLVNALLHHCRGQLSGIGGVARPGIVHRLDRDTSGCLVVAKNDLSHRALQEAFATRRVEKVYQCLVCGDLQPTSGEIRARIARHPVQRKKMAVTTGDGRDARTTYRVLEQLAGAAFVEAQIHTGRTHQVRVHFLHLGFPLVGDVVYGARANARLTQETGWRAPRQMLHARRLAFRHPHSGRWCEFNAPLPSDFKEALSVFRGAEAVPAN
ncbi:MAG TPA: RluA family pseudouridine synthase [Verrucomicrobiota bacterium]|nr:RluA family pseudouridine synthase [Verrucomicrobiales bacterium]HRI11726.1 RluA family pseudouridine synthase [Verrucomicrobiota bacterium]